jgi:hypothetical protein
MLVRFITDMQHMGRNILLGLDEDTSEVTYIMIDFESAGGPDLSKKVIDEVRYVIGENQ